MGITFIGNSFGGYVPLDICKGVGTTCEEHSCDSVGCARFSCTSHHCTKHSTATGIEDSDND